MRRRDLLVALITAAREGAHFRKVDYGTYVLVVSQFEFGIPDQSF